MIDVPQSVTFSHSESGTHPFTSTQPGLHDGTASQLSVSLCWHQMVEPHALRS
jgi:hypothetical protein